jgi:hypothetical protein
MLRMQSSPAVRWDLAACQEAQEKQGGSDVVATAVKREASLSIDAYCVDSGFGSFIDEAAIDAFLERPGVSGKEDERAAWDARVNYLLEHLDDADQSHRPSRYTIVLDEQSGVNMLMFTSGWGDGEYVSCWGFDASGSPVCLITDFGIFAEAEWMH